LQDDKQLVNRFQKGEERAFNELVRKYQTQIYAVARGMMRSHEEAEDIVQEVFIRVYQRLNNFRGDSTFFTWIYRITVNLSLNALRKRKARQILSIDNTGLSIASKADHPDIKMEKAETMERIARAIEKLPGKQKMVFTLRYYQGLPHAEIARIMNRDVGTIRANYHQAIRKLQKAVQL